MYVLEICESTVHACTWLQPNGGSKRELGIVTDWQGNDAAQDAQHCYPYIRLEQVFSCDSKCEPYGFKRGQVAYDHEHKRGKQWSLHAIKQH